MPRKRKRRRLIVRRGRGETEEEPFLLSMVCVIFMCPLREKIMRGKSIRCSCSLKSTGLLQGKPGELKKGEALKNLLVRELVLLREFSHRQRRLPLVTF